MRETARDRPTLKFENLLHHINVPLLHEAFDALKKSAAVGIDEVTWQQYEQDREASIEALHGRIHRGAYRAKPSKRIYISKADGRQRPIGIAALEDKIVQKATAWVMQRIYEQDFPRIQLWRPSWSRRSRRTRCVVCWREQEKSELDSGRRCERLL
ncbi:RNA-directed DNA polymerase (reverse transcriptase) [Rhodopirellula europaea SH398]|uniref:RNA-directed DNA polymerase (Reverse transcriptase) n=1 Tax=Rhodopirellula europaea SH398 TaxID=1263868 RepID=M5SCC7_9BACT|nr:RNA-directed DNA polymerase (reverse transcriptase) [Rhodopirellula europaea SH398]